jgi:CBS-domain-containing membrane protein
MDTTFTTIKDTSTIRECWDIMKSNDIKQIPTINENNTINGLVLMKTMIDEIIKNIENPKYIDTTMIKQIAITNIVTAQPTTDIKRVAKVMVKYNINTIPIVDERNDEIVGIIRRVDILNTVSTNQHYQLWA